MTSIEDLDDDFTSVKGDGKATSDKMESLPEGDYVFQITKGESKSTNNGPLVTLHLCTLAPGTAFDGLEIKRDYWLTEKDRATGERVKSTRNIDLLKKDLKTLGFDVDNWTKDAGRPFSIELPKAFGVIAGIRFHAKKSIKAKETKPNEPQGFWHNLFVNARDKSDGKPEAFGAAELEAASFEFA